MIYSKQTFEEFKEDGFYFIHHDGVCVCNFVVTTTGDSEGKVGSLEVVETMGSDQKILDMARISTDSKLKSTKLISRLIKDQHTSPFEHCIITIKVSCPIFVARQWFRHRTWSYSEFSMRYSEAKEAFYSPDTSRFVKNSKINHQAGEKGKFIDEPEEARNAMVMGCSVAFKIYQKLREMGVSKELSRIVLPVASTTHFYATVDLHNLLHFIKLRATEHAQPEIRCYAMALAEVVSNWCPVTWRAFNEFVKI